MLRTNDDHFGIFSLGYDFPDIDPESSVSRNCNAVLEVLFL